MTDYRNNFFSACVAVCALIWSCSARASDAGTSSSLSSNSEMLSPTAALIRLAEGNKRFKANQPTRQHYDAAWRQSLVGTQHPFAVILGCSDSRVPPELIFDQGFGDLFVIRVAGNIAGIAETGSIEYAVEHLHAPVVVVLGHESCGAVTAALGSPAERGHEMAELQFLLQYMNPAMERVPESADKGKKVEAGVAANVRAEVSKLRNLPGLVDKVKEKKLLIIGAVYHLDSGAVTVLDKDWIAGSSRDSSTSVSR